MQQKFCEKYANAATHTTVAERERGKDWFILPIQGVFPAEKERRKSGGSPTITFNDNSLMSEGEKAHSAFRGGSAAAREERKKKKEGAINPRSKQHRTCRKERERIAIQLCLSNPDKVVMENPAQEKETRRTRLSSFSG